MAVATKNSSGIPFLISPAASRCPGPHVDIVRYDVFLRYLVRELERASATEIRLSSEALIECLVKHRELTSGPNIWSPVARAYVPFQQQAHGEFAVLKAHGPTAVQFLGKLLPVYCRLCFLSECHDRAKSGARALLARLTTKSYRAHGGLVAEFEIRTLEYLIDNLRASPPAEWREVCQSSDVSPETKIATELLWSHLVLVYAGNRKLLLCNVALFLAARQDSLGLCPSELRAALFVHGKHDPFSLGRERVRRRPVADAGRCPILSRPPPRGPRSREGDDGVRRSRGVAAGNRLYESRVSRLCWLAALWALDIECNRSALHWLYKPEPHRGPR